MKVTKIKSKSEEKNYGLLKKPDLTVKQFMDARDWYLSAQNKDQPTKTQNLTLKSDP
jgi:hypothetical protein